MEAFLAAMNRCVKTIFERKVLCVGTMTDYVSIQRRELQGTTVNNTYAEEQFTEVDNFNGHLEARMPTQRFDGINMTDSMTHVIYIPFDQTIYELDRNTMFAEVEKTRNRFFKLLKIMNYGEDDEYLALFCKETGFSDLEAAEG